MDVSVNDLSFKGQFTTFGEIESCVYHIQEVVQVAEEFAGYEPVRRTRGLADRMLTPTDSIRSYMTRLFSSQNAADAKLLQNILLAFVKGPFIEEDEFDARIRGTASLCGEVVDDTSLHACFSRQDESVHAVISAAASPYDSVSEICLSGPACNNVPVMNFVYRQQCLPLIRYYDANEKHELLADKVVDGKVHTKMDLNSADALHCLRNGVQVLGDRYVYGFQNERWYEFRPHAEGRYHGFPITDPGNEGTLNRIKRVFGEPPYALAGYQFCLA